MNQMKSIHVRFIVHGAPVDIIMYEAAAREIIRKWTDSTYKLQGTTHISDLNCEGPWCIALDAIASIQLGQEVDVMALKSQQMAAQGGPPNKDLKPGWGSGLPAHLQRRG